MPTIAAILFVVAYNMCQWRTFVHLIRTAPKSDIIVLLTTFILTVVFDLVVAIEIGMVLACQVGERLGVTPTGTGERVRQVLKQYGLPTEDRFTWEEIVEATALDKKSDGATLRMILLSQIGESVIYPITREQLKPLL